MESPPPSKNARTRKSKKEGSTEDEDDIIEGAVIETTQQVSLTFSLEYLINFLNTAMPVFRRKFTSHHFFPYLVLDALLNHLVSL